MSQPMTPAARDPLPLRRRPAVLLATAVARLVVLLSPRRIRRILSWVRRGGPRHRRTGPRRPPGGRRGERPLRGEGCLQRSVATALLCRMRGVWPDWCTGVRTAPFRAHAWVEVDGRPIGEPHQDDYYRRLMVVPGLPVERPPGR
ncbi:lasso peptide biosynthesis B2 protein [Streptomyces stramineus]